MVESRSGRLSSTLLLALLVAPTRHASAWQGTPCPFRGCNPPACSTGPYGVNGFYGGREPLVAYDRAREAGIQWYRVTFLWDLIEPNVPVNGIHQFDWSTVQAHIDDASARGFPIVVDLLRTPSWARTGPSSACATAGKATALPPGAPPAGQPEYFYSFARAAVLQFGRQVAAWEMWGEVNSCGAWRGTPAQYKNRILAAGYDAVKGVDPNALVLAPGLLNATDFDTWLSYVDGAGHTWLKRPIDAYSIHLYGATIATAEGHLDAADGYFRCADPQFYPSAKCVADFWVTEFGYSETQGCGACGFPQPESPGYAGAAVLEHCLAVDAYCKKAFWYNMLDDFGGCCPIALLDANGVPREPKYDILKSYVLGHPRL